MTIDTRTEALDNFIVSGVCSSFVCELVQRTDKPKNPLGFGHAGIGGGKMLDVAKIWRAAPGNLLRFYNRLDPEDRNRDFLKARSLDVFKKEYCNRPYDLQDAQNLIGKIIDIVVDAHEATLLASMQPQRAPRRYYGKGKDRLDAYTFCG